MGILDEVSSATGDKTSNDELVKACLKTPALLHSVAEGLRTGGGKAKVDCGLILADVAKRRPDLLGGFVADFIDASHDKSKRVARLGLGCLAQVVGANPAEVFAERAYLLELARQGGTLGLEAARVLAALCAQNANYRGKLLGSLARVTPEVPDQELGKWLAAIAPAARGSADAVKRVTLAVQPRQPNLPDKVAQRVDRELAKLERSVPRRR